MWHVGRDVGQWPMANGRWPTRRGAALQRVLVMLWPASFMSVIHKVLWSPDLSCTRCSVVTQRREHDKSPDRGSSPGPGFRLFALGCTADATPGVGLVPTYPGIGLLRASTGSAGRGVTHECH